MLILILIDVQYLQTVFFSFEIGSNGQNHFPSGSHHPLKKKNQQNFQFPPVGGFSPPLDPIWKTLISDNYKEGVFMIIQLCAPIYTYPPFILEKLTWQFWRFHHIPPPLFRGMIPWLCGFSWYAWPHKNIFHIHHMTIAFSEKLCISKSVVQESNLNQIDGWVSILWEHLNYIQQQKRQDPFWDLGKWKKVPCCTSTQHNPCTQVCWVPHPGKMWCPRTWHGKIMQN